MESEIKPHEGTTSTRKHMPSVSTLIEESWETFKKSVLSIFLFNLVGFAVSFVIAVVGILIIFLSAFGASFTAGQNNLSASGGLIILTIIGAIVLFLAFLVWGMLLQIGPIFIVNAKGQIGIGEVIKKSFSLVLPVFLTGIIVFLINFGAFFVFIIPVFIFSIFFMFVNYEIVLEHKRGLGALRASMGLVTQNFWEILGRILILICFNFLLYFLIMLPAGILGEDSPLAMIFGLLYFVGSIIMGWFSLVYTFMLYKHAKEGAVEKQGSLLWPTIISVIGWVIVLFLIIAFGSAIAALASSDSFRKGFQNGMKGPSKMNSSYESTKRYSYGDELTQKEADYLAQDVFVLVNSYRKEQKLPVFEQDGKLCAYAQRRLQQLTDLGKYDDGKGFYEDLANNAMVNAYFTNYNYIGEATYDVTADTIAEEILDTWKPTSTANTKKTISNALYTNSCVRANPTFVVLVAGESR